MILRALDEFFWVLRRDGFSISTAQVIDASKVAVLVGFSDRAALRDALGAVIVERRVDLERYRRSFDQFFASGASHSVDLWDRLRQRGFSLKELDALRELLEAAAERSGAFGDAIGMLNLLGTESELDHMLMAFGIARTLAPMTSDLQTGYFAHKIMEQLAIPRAASALLRLRSVLRDALGEERGSALANALATELDGVRRRVRAHVERTLVRRLGDPGEQDARRRADELAFGSLSETEIAEVRRAVRGLAERLRGAERVRRKHALRGRIDPHRTLRRSLRTFGVPFQPLRKRRPRDKPRLIVLCDVSDSVRAASLFMLEFVHAAQELFSQTRSFVFVGDLAETTRLFDEHPASAALSRIYAGAAINLAHNSNYGRALRLFEERVGRSVDRRTTILILGDGRTNYLPDEVATVRRLRERARSLLWICPEPALSWGSGDSAMLRYASAATKVLIARTARELEDAAREIAARRR